MKARSFGFVAGPAVRSTVREPNLGTSEGLIRHSMQHGEMATLSAVAARGAVPNAPKQAVMVVDGRNGTRAVATVSDVERIRNRPPTRAEMKRQDANEDFLRQTNPNHEAPRREPMKRVDVGKRPLTRSKP